MAGRVVPFCQCEMRRSEASLLVSAVEGAIFAERAMFEVQRTLLTALTDQDLLARILDSWNAICRCIGRTPFSKLSIRQCEVSLSGRSPECRKSIRGAEIGADS